MFCEFLSITVFRDVQDRKHYHRINGALISFQGIEVPFYVSLEQQEFSVLLLDDFEEDSS